MEVRSWDQLQHSFLKYRDGDSTQVRALFEDLSQRLNRFCTSKGAREESADLTQQVLLKIHLGRDSYDSSKLFKGWVFSIAQNTLIDYWRKQKNWNLFFSLDTENETFENYEDLSLGLEQMYEIRQCLQEIMTSLKPFDQKLIYLYGWEEFSTIELAEVTSLSESAVKVKIHRILKNLLKERKINK